MALGGREGAKEGGGGGGGAAVNSGKVPKFEDNAVLFWCQIFCL